MRTLLVTTVVVVLALAPTAAEGEPTLARRALLAGKLSLLVPEGFAQMSDEMLRIKYPAERRPTIVLTNPEGSINVAVNHTRNSMQLAQVPEAHAAMDQTFRNMYPSAKWYRSEVLSIQGRRSFVLDLRTPAMDTEIRNIMVGTSLEGRFLIVTFNCTKELEAEWGSIGKRIVESARVER